MLRGDGHKTSQTEVPKSQVPVPCARVLVYSYIKFRNVSGVICSRTLEVFDAFARLMSIAPVERTMSQFVDYIFVGAYVGSSTFPPEIWAKTTDIGRLQTRLNHIVGI